MAPVPVGDTAPPSGPGHVPAAPSTAAAAAVAEGGTDVGAGAGLGAVRRAHGWEPFAKAKAPVSRRARLI